MGKRSLLVKDLRRGILLFGSMLKQGRISLIPMLLKVKGRRTEKPQQSFWSLYDLKENRGGYTERVSIFTVHLLWSIKDFLKIIVLVYRTYSTTNCWDFYLEIFPPTLSSEMLVLTGCNSQYLYLANNAKHLVETRPVSISHYTPGNIHFSLHTISFWLIQSDSGNLPY